MPLRKLDPNLRYSWPTLLTSRMPMRGTTSAAVRRPIDLCKCIRFPLPWSGNLCIGIRRRTLIQADPKKSNPRDTPQSAPSVLTVTNTLRVECNSQKTFAKPTERVSNKFTILSSQWNFLALTEVINDSHSPKSWIFLSVPLTNRCSVFYPFQRYRSCIQGMCGGWRAWIYLFYYFVLNEFNPWPRTCVSGCTKSLIVNIIYVQKPMIIVCIVNY